MNISTIITIIILIIILTFIYVYLYKLKSNESKGGWITKEDMDYLYENYKDIRQLMVDFSNETKNKYDNYYTISVKEKNDKTKEYLFKNDNDLYNTFAPKFNLTKCDDNTFKYPDGKIISKSDFYKMLSDKYDYDSIDGDIYDSMNYFAIDKETNKRISNYEIASKIYKCGDNSISDFDYQNTYNPSRKFSNFGWKIHVSPRPQYWIKILKLFYNIKRVHPEIRCKVIHISTDINMFNSNSYTSSSNQVSKFITIYPNSDEEAKNIVKLLQNTFNENNITPDMFSEISSEFKISPGIFTRLSIYDGTGADRDARDSIYIPMELANYEDIEDISYYPPFNTLSYTYINEYDEAKTIDLAHKTLYEINKALNKIGVPDHKHVYYEYEDE